MKTVNGNLWTEDQPSGYIHIGFTKRFIEERLGECFHVMQAETRNVKQGAPMLVIETNDGLVSLKSPVSARIITFNDKARNFPDRLTEEDMVLKVLPEGVKPKVEEKAKKVKKMVDVPELNWNVDIQQVALDRQPVQVNQPEVVDRAEIERQPIEVGIQVALNHLLDRRGGR